MKKVEKKKKKETKKFSRKDWSHWTDSVTAEEKHYYQGLKENPTDSPRNYSVTKTHYKTTPSTGPSPTAKKIRTVSLAKFPAPAIRYRGIDPFPLLPTSASCHHLCSENSFPSSGGSSSLSMQASPPATRHRVRRMVRRREACRWGTGRCPWSRGGCWHGWLSVKRNRLRRAPVVAAARGGGYGRSEAAAAAVSWSCGILCWFWEVVDMALAALSLMTAARDRRWETPPSSWPRDSR